MKTLTRLGSAVSVETEDGAVIDLRGSLLYDETGSAWPSCSLLIAGFARGGKIVEPTKFARGWSRDHEWRAGSIALPPRELSQWAEGPRLHTLLYTKEPDDLDLQHPFGTVGGVLGRLIPMRFGKLPTLYRRGSAARIELGSGCVVSAAGVVSP